MEAKRGDEIEILTNDNEQFKGLYINEEKTEGNDFVIVKIKSGYNIGINKKRIKSIKVTAKEQKTEKKGAEVKQNKALPKITILHTGGTIASKVDYKTGGVSAEFTPEELLKMFPEIKDIAVIKSKLISNIFSEDRRFENYNTIAREIEKESANCDGIIITHGTDTMHYTSAALFLMLQNLNMPVLLVGAQRSSDRGSTDAAINLISAVIFEANTDFADVAICMHETADDENCVILPGQKSRKMHSSRRDAFKAVNAEPVARVNYKTKRIDLLERFRKKSDSKIKLMQFNPKLKIGIVKAHPNMFAEEILFYRDFDGLVIEGTGLGHISINEEKEGKKILDAIKTVAKKIPVVMATQTIYGSVNMNVYSTGRKLVESGVLGNMNDLTAEGTFIKLAWVLSSKLEPKKYFG